MLAPWQRPDSARSSSFSRAIGTGPLDPAVSRMTAERAQSLGDVTDQLRSVSVRRSSFDIPPIQSHPSPTPLPVKPAGARNLQSSSDSRADFATKEGTHHWANRSPVEESMPSPEAEELAAPENTITVCRQTDTVPAMLDRTGNDMLTAIANKPKKASLPTPTRELPGPGSAVGTLPKSPEPEMVATAAVSASKTIPESIENDGIGKTTPTSLDDEEVQREGESNPGTAPSRDQLMVDAAPLDGTDVNAAISADAPTRTEIQVAPTTTKEAKDVVNVKVPVEGELGAVTVGSKVAPAVENPSAVRATAPQSHPAADTATRSRRSSARIPRASEPRRTSRKSKVQPVAEEPSTELPVIVASAPSEPRKTDASKTLDSVPEMQRVGQEDCQSCKVPYAKDDGRNGAWIGCDGCKNWHHARCVNLDQAAVDKIDRFYCVACEPKHGTSTYKRSSGRARTAIDYDALHNGSSAPMRNPEDPRIHPYITKILDGNHKFAEDNLQRIRPELVNSVLIDGKEGIPWTQPFIVPAKWNPTPWHNSGDSIRAANGSAESLEDISQPEAPQSPPNGATKRTGSPLPKSKQSPPTNQPSLARREGADALDMRIPTGLTVRRVAELIGLDTPVPMMDVVTQENVKDWTIGRLADYFDSPVKERIYNCISCEVSNSKLGEDISRPKAVRESDLVDRLWHYVPGYNKPNVGKYILMSVKDSFTDFHVDFGGSSVFYHIYEGKKVFLAIPPTDKALKVYEKWSSNDNMAVTFLPDLLPDVPCMMITLEKGDTFFIPSGWIHAVYTPVDSLVIGGNFLTRNFYANQMKIFNIEAVTGVPQVMRYPRYTTLMWASMLNYIKSDRMPREIEKEVLTDIFGRKSKTKSPKNAPVYSVEELKGLTNLLDFLYRNVMIVLGVITTSQRPGAPKLTKSAVEGVRKAIPWPISRNPLLYLKHFARWCIWKRACADIVPGGEKIPDWAQVDWSPPKLSASADETSLPPDTETATEVTSIRRDGLRDRSKFSVAPEDTCILENFDYFPERTAPAVSGLHGARNQAGSPSTGPKSTKRKSDVGLTGSASKKAKATRRSVGAGSEGLKNGTEQHFYLSDGSLYVKKLSNLGPPRIGCESCRLKKTGCKHKEEIRANGWCDDDRFTQDAEPAKDAPPVKKAPLVKDAQSAKKASPTKEASPAKKASPAKEAPSAKKASPAQEVPAAKKASAEKDVPSMKESTPDNQVPQVVYAEPAGDETQDCETLPAIAEESTVIDTISVVTPVKSVASHDIPKESSRSALNRRARSSSTELSSPPKSSPLQQKTSSPPPPLADVIASVGPPLGYKGRKPSCAECKQLKKKCLHQDTWKLIQDKQASHEVKKVDKKREQTPRHQSKETKKSSAASRRRSGLGVPPTPTPVVEERHSIVLKQSVGLPSADAPKLVEKTPPPAEDPLKKVLSSEKVPTKDGKEKSKEDFGLGLDTSILEEVPQYTTAKLSPAAADPTIMAPPIGDDDPVSDSVLVVSEVAPELPVTTPTAPVAPSSPVTPATAKTPKNAVSPADPAAQPCTSPNEIMQREYRAALNQRPSASKAKPKTKVTYTSTNKSIKRKAEEESPDANVLKKVATGQVDGTTLEHFRQASFGLRVRGQVKREVC